MRCSPAQPLGGHFDEYAKIAYRVPRILSPTERVSKSTEKKSHSYPHGFAFVLTVDFGAQEPLC